MAFAAPAPPVVDSAPSAAPGTNEVARVGRSRRGLLAQYGTAQYRDPSTLSITELEQIARDATVKFCLRWKQLLITNHIGAYEGPGDEATELVAAAVAQMEGTLDQMIQQAVWDGLVYGFVVLERVYRAIRLPGGRTAWGLRKLKTVSPHTIYPTGIRCDEFGNLQALIQYPGSQGEIQLPLDRMALWTPFEDHGNRWGAKALEAVHGSWQVKGEIAYRFLPQHLERFGMPITVGTLPKEEAFLPVTLPDGRELTMMDVLGEALDGLASRASIVVPRPEGFDGKVVELLYQPAAAGNSGFKEAWQAYDNEMFKALLTPSLTAQDSQHATRAATESHADVAMMDPEDIAQRLASELLTEQVARPLVELNYGPQADYGVWHVEPFTEADRKTEAEIVEIMTASGYMSPDRPETCAYVAEQIGAPDDVIAPSEMPVVRAAGAGMRGVGPGVE
jgi:hypothetical protein